MLKMIILSPVLILAGVLDSAALATMLFLTMDAFFYLCLNKQFPSSLVWVTYSASSISLKTSFYAIASTYCDFSILEGIVITLISSSTTALFLYTNKYNVGTSFPGDSAMLYSRS